MTSAALDPPAPLRLSTARLLVCSTGEVHPHRLCDYYLKNRDFLAPWDPPAPPGFYDHDRWLERVASHERERIAGVSLRTCLVSRSAPDGPVWGVANLTQIVRGPFLCASLGYSLDEDHEGSGLMREALEALIAHAFGPLGLHRIQANYLPINERSGRLLRRLGFVVEGYARDYLFIAGAWRDHVLTSLTNSSLASDWKPQRS